MKHIRIFVADDHSAVRDGIRAVINSQQDMVVVGESGDGHQALQEISKLLPDLVLMDITMPQLDGIEASKRLSALHPEIKILGFTAHNNLSFLCRFLATGAAGIVHKFSDLRRLIDAIRHVADGGIYVDTAFPGVKTKDHTDKACIASLIRRSKLSPHENCVLRGIALGYSNKEIAAQLGISVKTVETYKARFVTKLGLRSRVHIVQYALAEGWLTENQSATG